jgi:hypothetical protein
MIDGLEAVRQAVFKMLQTPRFEHLIYSDSYGLEPVMGLGGAVFRSEMERRIEETLLQDDRISEVSGIEFTFTGDEVQVVFSVVSSFGEFQVSKAVSGGV